MSHTRRLIFTPTMASILKYYYATLLFISCEMLLTVVVVGVMLYVPLMLAWLIQVSQSVLHIYYAYHCRFKSLITYRKCVYDLSDLRITVWRRCWAVRIMRAAPRCTTPADWAFTTQWRTCWASPGRTASLTSPRIRSLACTLPLSKFKRS